MLTVNMKPNKTNTCASGKMKLKKSSERKLNDM